MFNVGVQDAHKVDGSENSVTATIKDLTIIGNTEYIRAGINAYAMRDPTETTGKTDLTLQGVTIQDCGTFSLGINNSTVKIEKCDLADGGWTYAIDADKGTTNLIVESGTIGTVKFGKGSTLNNAAISNGDFQMIYVVQDAKQDIRITGGTYANDVSGYCAEGYAYCKYIRV